MKRAEWDFLIVNFSTLDRAQHEFWAAIDPQHPRHVNMVGFQEVIPRVYEQLDAAVGELMKEAEGDVQTFVISDHGAGPDYDAVLVNSLLQREGFLSARGSPLLFLRSLAQRAVLSGNGRLVPVIKELLRRFRSVSGWTPGRGDRSSYEAHVPQGLAEQIDWQNTKAYFAPDRGGIWINVEGRERTGIVPERDYSEVVKQVKRALLGWVFPVTGESIFQDVLVRQQTFSGRYAELIPDLIPIPSRGSISALHRVDPTCCFMKPTWCSGAHSRQGIFVVAGPGVRRNGRIENTRLHDVVPTVLYSMSLPLTQEMDGEVLLEIFSDDYKASRRIVRQGTSYLNGSDSRGLTKEEASVVERRLAELGYIT
jgi:predicted AlkP superfamily phosphohydrolase/phosphomutase